MCKDSRLANIMNVSKGNKMTWFALLCPNLTHYIFLSRYFAIGSHMVPSIFIDLLSFNKIELVGLELRYSNYDRQVDGESVIYMYT